MNKKVIVISALCLLALALSAVGVYAYLTAKTTPVSNEFVPAKVSCMVEEVFENGVKSDVKIRNTGNVDAYIRAAVIVNFVNADGNIVATAPKEDVDYTVTWGPEGWTKGADGYWYYKKAVAPEDVTLPLIVSASPTESESELRLQIQILASAFQAAPESAVIEAWKVSVTDGEIIPD